MYNNFEVFCERENPCLFIVNNQIKTFLIEVIYAIAQSRCRAIRFVVMFGVDVIADHMTIFAL
jgi:hypothetical protein